MGIAMRGRSCWDRAGCRQVGTLPYQTLMQRLQVVEVVDQIYRLESRLVGGRPGQGARQCLALEPGPSTDGTVPCGRSGIPVRLGVSADTLSSCFGGSAPPVLPGPAAAITVGVVLRFQRRHDAGLG